MTDVSRDNNQLRSELEAATARLAELEARQAGHQAEAENLRRSQALYRSVVENVGIGLTLVDQDHTIIMANAAQGVIFGKAPEALVGKKCFEEFEKREAVCPHCPGLVAIRTGQPAMVETTGTRDDGSTNYARIEAFPVRDAGGNSLGFVELVQDITEHKRAEEAKRASEERFRLLVEHAADAFFLHDETARIVDVNRQACDSLGYTRDELLSLSVQDFDPAFNHSGLAHWRDLVPGETETVERVHVRRDGSTFPVEVRLGVVESGKQRFYLALVRDVTERKRAEQALARRAVQLQTGAEVAQAAGSILEPLELAQKVVVLIGSRFDLYYVGLFLLDETRTLHSKPGEWAVLQAATGEAGQAMLKERYRLRVGSNSMVGQCIAQARPVIALQVGQQEVRLANPLLPETRSELALPLVSRSKAIGALTIQSRDESAFGEADVAVLEIMAGQIANSIENARLYKQTQAALEDMEATHRHYLRQEWSRYLGRPSPPDKKKEP